MSKQFTPEFLNRLSATVVFNDMDSNMAQLILEKKLREFSAKLEANKVTMEIGADAKEWLLKKSITKEYGAREMDRVIGHHLKPGVSDFERAVGAEIERCACRGGGGQNRRYRRQL